MGLRRLRLMAMRQIRNTELGRLHGWAGSATCEPEPVHDSRRFLHFCTINPTLRTGSVGRGRQPQPDARSVGQPEPAALRLLMRDLQPLALPDTLDPLVVDCPARLAQQFGDLAIAIAAVLPSKLDNI